MPRKILFTSFVLIFLISSCSPKNTNVIPTSTISPQSVNENVSPTQNAIPTTNELNQQMESVTPEAKLSSSLTKFVGIWEVQPDTIQQQGEGRLFAYIGLRNDAQAWLGYRPNGLVMPYTWRADNRFIYLDTTDETSYAAPVIFRYEMVDQNTLTLFHEDGSQARYKRYSTNDRTSLQTLMVGRWECTYNAGFGETVTNVMTCDDLHSCWLALQTTKQQTYRDYAYSYEPIISKNQINKLSEVPSFSMVDAEMAKGELTLNINGVGAINYAIKEGELIPQIPQTDMEKNIFDKYFLSSCKKIGN